MTAPTVTYAQSTMDRLAVALPGLDPSLLRLYAVLALTKGTGTTMEDVHDSWALWRAQTRPDHPSIVPFGDLPPEVQELDRPYMEAIRAVAAGVAP
jgi:hypothetical protein